jgi:hypothetical protein
MALQLRQGEFVQGHVRGDRTAKALVVWHP